MNILIRYGILIKVVVEEENMSVDQGMTPQDDEDAKKQAEQPESEESQEFSFLQETIKDEQPNGKRTFNRIIKTAGLGLIFGLAGCMGFYALRPWAESKFQKDPSEIVIPKDNDEDTQKDPEEKDKEEEPVQKALTIDNYRELNASLYEIAAASSKCVVEVNGIQDNSSWIDTTYDTKNSASGVFAGDNGQELLVLTYSSILKDAKSLTITFTDNQSYPAKLKKKDETLGLAVVSVQKNKVKKGTLSQIEQAQLGNSNTTSRGEAVIALGKHFGYAGGIGYGIISSTRNSVMLTDGEYQLISTDIPAVSDGNGVLFDLNGEVIGLIQQSISENDSMHMVTAYAVSDLKGIIQELLNGNSIPYVGINGVDVSEAVAEEEDMPTGVYVAEVSPDSPAMSAGIKSGDIIVKIEDEEIINLHNYQRVVMDYHKGDEVKMEGKRLGPEGYVDISFKVTIGSQE